ncbi:Small membrane A-kinase anchor protein [Collichthys lucidus]|uniref:Small membrane A-kinase anchor protein n=1 Tax=Collichthys lucidus TaxID=240159 RepID=A0A4U5TYD2_COLLU|nr:Small membrane A-kinase anchor protein [Collichthys lucidus]
MMPTAPPVPRRNGKQSVEMLGLFGQTEGDGRGQTRRNKARKPILDFAQKMSEDIVAQALLLCWEVEIRYKDMPFIDVECEYAI